LLPLDIDGYDQIERSHASVALAVAGGTADVGLGTEYAARSARLDFVPITDERYLLVCLKSSLEDPPMQRLLQCLRSHAWQARMSALPGYQPDHCGEVAAMKRLLPWWDS
jgi:putative molybdopterin biosynthesis protein